MMFKIEPNAIYSKTDLEALLDGEGLDLRWLLDNVRPRKLDRSHWFGGDILAAVQGYTEQREREAIDRQAAAALARPGRRRKRAAGAALIPMPTR